MKQTLPPARDPRWFNTPLGGLPTNVTKQGYVIVKVGKRWEGLHRMIIAQMLGRPLWPDEEVHHKDEARANNDPANLILTSKSEHASYHTGPRTPRKRHKRTRYPLLWQYWQ